ncbi:hypothetical protein AALP_AA8G095800 [Arabis alpina]|uniref:Uncharacterized protein n=1 Tax=Arabis alpina TaxID=50452 RepID=A0A087G606_ARAAL|nr:hypothetical protein AALP_AA8G095800 [Arabis alpina]
MVLKIVQSLLLELERLTDEAALAIETATELDTESSDELVTCDEENTTLPFPQVTEYATLIAVVYSMVKQNYAMQEKIVKSLSLKSSSGELETYTLMWSLCPFTPQREMLVKTSSLRAGIINIATTPTIQPFYGSPQAAAVRNDPYNSPRAVTSSNGARNQQRVYGTSPLSGPKGIKNSSYGQSSHTKLYRGGKLIDVLIPDPVPE